MTKTFISGEPAMSEALNLIEIKAQLQLRRIKLEAIAREAKNTQQFTTLLDEIDRALKRVEEKTYGLCEVCHESIESDRLAVDPFLRTCLDHLTEAEQKILERDLNLAYSVQSNLLPKRGTTIEGWSTAHLYRPAGAVGGDFCDLIVSPDDPRTLYFLIGDISGKGVAASLLMAHLHAIFRALIHPGLNLADLLAKANRLFAEGTMMKHFATIIVGKAEAGGRVELCNAAHCNPLVVRGSAIGKVEAPGLPLGLFPHCEYVTTTLSLAPGESLFLYTDGLVEARNQHDEFYGEERLRSVLSGQSAAPAELIVESALASLRSFVGHAPAVDDVTLLSLKRIS